MRTELITALPLLAACVTAQRPPTTTAQPPEPPFQSVSFQARVAAESEPGAPPRWTDFIIDGAGREQRRACALAVASELRSITAMPGAKGSVIRDCATAPLPMPPASGARGVVLVESRAAGDELRAEATMTQTEPLPELLRARLTTFTRYSSPEACADMLAQAQEKRREITLRQHNEATERVQRQIAAAEAERDTSCANQRAVAAQCDALPSSNDLADACKVGQGSRRCRTAQQQARARRRCETGMRSARHDCDRTQSIVEEARKRLPPRPRTPGVNQPICQPG